MGSRYGRNKRRAHREEIASLSELNRRRKDAIERLESKLGLVKEFDERIAHTLGEQSAYRLMPAETTGKVSPLIPLYRMQASYGPADYLTPVDMKTAYERMYRFIIEMEHDDFNHARKIKIVETNQFGQIVAINISESELQDVMLRRSDAVRFGTMIADKLLRFSG